MHKIHPNTMDTIIVMAYEYNGWKPDQIRVESDYNRDSYVVTHVNGGMWEVNGLAVANWKSTKQGTLRFNIETEQDEIFWDGRWVSHDEINPDRPVKPKLTDSQDEWEQFYRTEGDDTTTWDALWEDDDDR